ncbi:efflux RND transporter periplasmic adaptor subunit [Methyloligella solikamskensis]|uniref:Efflux RND transporter periplasmic adaptor subunit n=1 Tax=Methyloligella solikamskensis TaxID=1177756 RepID=A0ABW3J7W9_9HYPH
MHLKKKPVHPARIAHPASALVALFAVLALTLSLAACGDLGAEEDGSHAEDSAHEGHDHGAEETGHEEHDHGAEEPDHEGHDHGEEEAGHEGHADNEGHEGHGHEEHGPIHLTEEQREEFGIEVAQAQTGAVTDSFTLPAEVHYNGDRLAHVVPRVSGIATEVNATEGDDVKEGDLLAVLDSRELADAKSDFLATLERENLEETKYAREQQLWDKKITSERTYLDAKSALAEARIARRGTEQKLYALGISAGQLDNIRNEKETVLTTYRLTAPFDGHVVKRHITLGEFIDAEQQAFVVADLSTLWIDLSVFPGDLDRIEKGQTVEILDDRGNVIAQETIAFVTPQIEEGTRTAIARIIADPAGGRLRPGMFLTARVTVDSGDAVKVPRIAVQTVEDKPAVFVETDDGFEPRPVTLGPKGENDIVITDGLKPGERIVTQGAFTLKAEMSKGSFGGHHH